MDLLRWKIQWDYDPRDLEQNKEIIYEDYKALGLMIEEHERIKRMGEKRATNIKQLKKQLKGGIA